MSGWISCKAVYRICKTKRRVIYCCILALVLVQFAVFHWNKTVTVERNGAMTRNSLVKNFGAVTRDSLPLRDVTITKPSLQEIMEDINKTRKALVHVMNRISETQTSPILEVLSNTSKGGDFRATDSVNRQVFQKHRESLLMRRPDTKMTNDTNTRYKQSGLPRSSERTDMNNSLALREQRLKLSSKRLLQHQNFSKTPKFNITLEKEKHALIVSKLNKTLIRNDTCNGCFKHNFNYDISGEHICSGRADIELVFLITTAHTHFKRRSILRNTWLSTVQKAPNMVYVFLLGETKDRNLSRRVKIESNTYNDIIQEDFVDTYQNLTYKTIMALKWVTHACPQAKYVMKTDDDMFVYSHSLLNFLHDTKTEKLLDNSTIGRCWTSLPIRHNHPKYFTSYESYPHFSFPPICSGTGYLMGMRTAQKIYEVSQNVPFFHLEDVYVGLCLEQLGIGTHNHAGFSVTTRSPLCAVGRRLMYSVHTGSDVQMQRIWNSCINYERNRNRLRSGYWQH